MKKFLAALALVAISSPALADSVRIDVYGNQGGFSYHHHERRSYGVQEYRQYIPPAPIYVAPPPAVYYYPGQPLYAPQYRPLRPRYEDYHPAPHYHQHQHNHHHHYGR